jgi:hypothetical protein
VAEKWRGYVMVVTAALCWGVMATVAKLLFRDGGVDPLILVVVRADPSTRFSRRGNRGGGRPGDQ